MSEHKKDWRLLAAPPKDALKTIGGGRLKGFTDVNPVWRFEAMVEVYGPYGIGWYFTVDRTEERSCGDNEVMVFVWVSLYLKGNGEGRWLKPIPGVGGAKLVEMEKTGLYNDDDAYKKALTDALSVAMKPLGMAAEIYRGRWDGSKYLLPTGSKPKAGAPTGRAATGRAATGGITDAQGRLRHTKDKGLDENIQKAEGKILNAQYKQLQKEVCVRLSKNTDAFSRWLRSTYQVEFYDITTEMLAGIMGTITQRPQEIMEYAK